MSLRRGLQVTEGRSNPDAASILDHASPDGQPYTIRPLLEDDETYWFVRAIDSGLVAFRNCAAVCPRRRRWKVSGPDEFVTPDRQLRHLFSLPPEHPRLNREYIPHIAAYAKAIVAHAYDGRRSSFSRYRSFQRDAITKRAGTGYETDAEFYARDGSIWLHLEAKRDARQVDRIAGQLAASDLRELPISTVKEIEYVLDLRPKFLWVVGPGSVDPPKHVFKVEVDGLSARFEALADLPAPD